MSHPSFRRYMPCTLAVEVVPTPSLGVLHAEFRLALPSFGFEITALALISSEVIKRSPDPDAALVELGRDALARALAILMDRPTFHVPHPPPPSSRADQAADDGLPPSSLRLSETDKEMLRGYKISPE